MLASVWIAIASTFSEVESTLTSRLVTVWTSTPILRSNALVALFQHVIPTFEPEWICSVALEQELGTSKNEEPEVGVGVGVVLSTGVGVGVVVAGCDVAGVDVVGGAVVGSSASTGPTDSSMSAAATAIALNMRRAIASDGSK